MLYPWDYSIEDGKLSAVLSGDLNVKGDPILNSFWVSVHPFLDENYANVRGKPTAVERGIFKGYSFPVWSTPANEDEELSFRMRVPHRWDGSTNPHFVAITAPSSAETIDDKYQFQFEWQSGDVGALLPDTTQETLTSEVTLITGQNAAWFAHIIDFELTATTIVRGQNLQARLRRIAASASEVAAEPVVFHWDTRWKMSKIGTVTPMGY